MVVVVVVVLFSHLMAAALCASACSICTSVGEILFCIHIVIIDYPLCSPVSSSFTLHHVSVSTHIVNVLHQPNVCAVWLCIVLRALISKDKCINKTECFASMKPTT
jgi:hypothetical protein